MRLLAGSRFVYPNNGCFSRCVTVGAGGDRSGQASTPEENLDVIKTQECSGMFNSHSCTHIAMTNTFIIKIPARKMTWQLLD